MRLTKEMQKAGIIEISSLRNGNGSYTANVVLDAIDRESNGTNFRPFREAHSNEFAGENFNRQAVRNPVLVWTGKKLKSIDGRHTIHTLLEKRKHKTWTAEVHFKMTHEQAASVFFELTQNSKRMGPWDAYAAALEAEYAFALDIDAALLRHGFSTPNDDGYNKNTADFDGFTPLLDSHRLGKNFLHTFLTTLRAWKNGDTRLQDRARKNPFQRGLIDFLVEHNKDYSARDFAAILGKRSASEITERAVDFDQSCGGSRPDRTHFKMAFESVMGIGSRRRMAA